MTSIFRDSFFKAPLVCDEGLRNQGAFLRRATDGISTWRGLPIVWLGLRLGGVEEVFGIGCGRSRPVVVTNAVSFLSWSAILFPCAGCVCVTVGVRGYAGSRARLGLKER